LCGPRWISFGGEFCYDDSTTKERLMGVNLSAILTVNGDCI